AIDKEIKEAALKNPEIKQFLSSLGSASTFIWRDIENSKSKSYHSFGIAIDINPKKLGNKQVYWKWTSIYNEKWYSVPYSQRWMVHPEVVKIFEKYGFVWGGKWLPFDNMHFEYRPEILIFSGKEVAGL
ncbi:MAG: M15 family metallopeptidase, partial [Spirochaetaceae bacterium]|nr:M15 family metallopeptidase [Spirochaetaceae bacterium]